MTQQCTEGLDTSYWLNDPEITDFDLAEQVRNASFYLDADDQIVICFDQGDVAPMAMGVISFTIPSTVVDEIRIR